MPTDGSIQTFACPACGGALEPKPGAQTIKCEYCGGMVVIPESLRTPASQTMNLGSRQFDVNAMFKQSALMPQVFTLARQGNLEEAAMIYSELAGVTVEAAMSTVKYMAGL